MESLYNDLVLLRRVSYPHIRALVHVGRSVGRYVCFTAEQMGRMATVDDGGAVIFLPCHCRFCFCVCVEVHISLCQLFCVYVGVL